LPFTAPRTATAALNAPISEAEVSAALQRLHNGRSGALLGYTSEFLRYAVQHLMLLTQQQLQRTSCCLT
jgi:hypothetical protein